MFFFLRVSFLLYYVIFAMRDIFWSDGRLPVMLPSSYYVIPLDLDAIRRNVKYAGMEVIESK